MNMEERHTDDLVDAIMDSGFDPARQEEIREFMQMLCMGLGFLWPDAANGEYSLKVNDKHGNPVVEFGGSVPFFKRTHIGDN